MFMQIAIGAIGVAIVLFVGYIIVAQVRTALPSSTSVGYVNSCYNHNLSESVCTTVTATSCANSTGGTTDNTSYIMQCSNGGYTSGTNSAMTTVFAGFGLVAVGIIVLAAFGLIQVFQ